MGRSLLKRTRNEDVAVPTPAGVADYAVIDIAYVPDGEF
jgi:transcription elongation GreA/GreB family factor